MKLVTYFRNQTTSCGVLTDAGIIDVASIWPGPDNPKSVLEILARGHACLQRIAELAAKADIVTGLSQVRLLAPIQRPGKIIGLAGNYSEHIKEVGKALGLSDSPRNTTTPRPFIMPSTCIIGPGDEIQWPCYSEQIDYEIELCAVIGKTAKCIDPEHALDYVAGYMICNDISARSVTFKRERAVRPWDEFYDWLNGKWADGFLPIGPYLVTADEIPDVQNLNMELAVNGQIRQKANTGHMIYSVADIVSFLSHILTLEPGDIIATGTPSGVAMATGNFLKAGDIIECGIDKLGQLHNTLSMKPKEFYKPLKKPI